jgi:hypothetical protein
LSAVRINGSNPGQIASGQPFEVSCALHFRDELAAFRLFCIIQDANGDAIVVAPTNHREISIERDAGPHEITVGFPGLWLRPGVYSAHFKLLVNTADAGSGRILSDVAMLDVSGTADPEMLLGYVTPESNWKVTTCMAAGMTH